MWIFSRWRPDGARTVCSGSLILRRGPPCLVSLLCFLSVAGVVTAPAQRGPAAPGSRAIYGKVVTDTPHPPDQPIEVVLEGPSSQRIDTAIVDGGGNFRFMNVPAGSLVYVVVDVDGFERFREAVDTSVWFGSDINIFLRSRTDTVVLDPTPVDLVVDLAQLQAEVPEAARQDYERALEDVRRGKHLDASERLERVVALAPEYYEAQNSLGVQYMELGRFRDAEAALGRAAAINPSGATALINLGSLYLREGDGHADRGSTDEARACFERALDTLQRAIRLNPLSALATYFLGTALYKTGAYQAAEAALLRAIEADPDLHEARLTLTNVYVRLNRFDRALESVDQYLKHAPDGPLRDAAQRVRAQIEPLIP